MGGLDLGRRILQPGEPKAKRLASVRADGDLVEVRRASVALFDEAVGQAEEVGLGDDADEVALSIDYGQTAEAMVQEVLDGLAGGGGGFHGLDLAGHHVLHAEGLGVVAGELPAERANKVPVADQPHELAAVDDRHMTDVMALQEVIHLEEGIVLLERDDIAGHEVPDREHGRLLRV
jgi:hypothetical protein